jgi:hypothetical protein
MSESAAASKSLIFTFTLILSRSIDVVFNFCSEFLLLLQRSIRAFLLRPSVQTLLRGDGH